MNRYWLAPHVVACETPAGAIFLDLKRNRYLGVGLPSLPQLAACLPAWPPRIAASAGHATQFAPEIPDETPDETRDPIASVLAAGLLLDHEPTTASFGCGTTQVSVRLSSLADPFGLQAPLRFSHVCRFLRAYAWANDAVHHRTLYSVACEIRQRQQSLASDPAEARVAMLVQRFRRLRPFAFTARDQCLFHALALLHFLNAHGVGATWMIGVRTQPWAAHSWVQWGSSLLDSTPEQVCDYTPILSV